MSNEHDKDFDVSGVEPAGPIWQRGKAQGKSDDEIWADYDAAREAGDGTADR